MALSSLTGSVTEKGVNCRRLKDQLDTLERETTDKLGQMEQYNKELKVSAEQTQGAEKFSLSHVSALQGCGVLMSSTLLHFALSNLIPH